MIRYVTSKIKKVFTSAELDKCSKCGKQFPLGVIVCPWCSSERSVDKCEKRNKEE
jgi:DNA-directed RNA polymerase subunit RPC12/RpoP